MAVLAFAAEEASQVNGSIGRELEGKGAESRSVRSIRQRANTYLVSRLQELSSFQRYNRIIFFDWAFQLFTQKGEGKQRNKSTSVPADNLGRWCSVRFSLRSGTGTIIIL